MNLEQLRRFKPQIQALARQYKIDPDSIRVFGSVARGEETKDSDIDFLVSTLPACSLFDLGGMYMDCKDLLGSEVDVVTDKGIDPLMKPYITQHVVAL